MRVELTSDVFQGDGFGPIINLVEQFADNRHQWIVDPDHLDLIKGYFREHAPTKVRTYGSLAESGVVKQEAWTPRRRSKGLRPVTVTVTPASLKDHVWDLARSARVVVENREGDGAFVLAVARVFGADRIVEAANEGWLEFVQGGGSGEVPKVARHEHSGFKRLTRVVFLFDSDRMTPEAVSKQQNAADGLRAEGIPGHLLHFREAENYVPDLVLEQVSSRRAEQLKTLVPRQRAYFDVKKGFVDKQGNFCIPASQQNLYSDVPQETKRALAGGFGKELTQTLGQEANAGRVLVEHFAALGPGVCEELEELLDLIKKII